MQRSLCFVQWFYKRKHLCHYHDASLPEQSTGRVGSLEEPSVALPGQQKTLCCDLPALLGHLGVAVFQAKIPKPCISCDSQNGICQGQAALLSVYNGACLESCNGLGPSHSMVSHGQGHLPLPQAAPSPTQPGLCGPFTS